jgi:hypothetical protein
MVRRQNTVLRTKYRYYKLSGAMTCHCCLHGSYRSKSFMRLPHDSEVFASQGVVVLLILIDRQTKEIRSRLPTASKG